MPGITGHKLVFLLVCSIVLLGCLQPATEKKAEPFVNYHYTAEAAYFDANISDSQIVFTHLDQARTKEKCSQWTKQSPCWTNGDLKTEKAELSLEESGALRNLINETKLIELWATSKTTYYCAVPKNSRFYGYNLTINVSDVEKKIIYCSAPDGLKAPEAFIAVTNKIEEIVKNKFYDTS